MRTKNVVALLAMLLAVPASVTIAGFGSGGAAFRLGEIVRGAGSIGGANSADGLSQRSLVASATNGQIMDGFDLAINMPGDFQGISGTHFNNNLGGGIFGGDVPIVASFGLGNVAERDLLQASVFGRCDCDLFWGVSALFSDEGFSNDSNNNGSNFDTNVETREAYAIRGTLGKAAGDWFFAGGLTLGAGEDNEVDTELDPGNFSEVDSNIIESDNIQADFYAKHHVNSSTSYVLGLGLATGSAENTFSVVDNNGGTVDFFRNGVDADTMQYRLFGRYNTYFGGTQYEVGASVFAGEAELNDNNLSIFVDGAGNVNTEAAVFDDATNDGFRVWGTMRHQVGAKVFTYFTAAFASVESESEVRGESRANGTATSLFAEIIESESDVITLATTVAFHPTQNQRLTLSAIFNRSDNESSTFGSSGVVGGGAPLFITNGDSNESNDTGFNFSYGMRLNSRFRFDAALFDYGSGSDDIGRAAVDTEGIFLGATVALGRSNTSD